MTSIKFPLAGCAVAAALGALAAVGVAHAQPAPGGQGAQGQGAQGQGGQNGMQQLHDALHLTSRQQQAWQAYQAGLQLPPGQQQQMRAMAQMQLSTMSTPQRLDIINEGMNMQITAFHHTADATRTFYATLTPSQQKTFDQITTPPSRNAQQR